MKKNQNSSLMWAIFIAIVVGIVVIAIPQYVTLAKEIHVAQARDLAAGLTAVTAVNYTQKKRNPSNGVAIKSCKDVTNITGNNLPPGYHISDEEVQSEVITNCTLSAPGISGVPFSVIGIS
jgi:hypothetical protein